MTRTLEMFERVPRTPRRVLMHAVDHGYADGAGKITYFVCPRCKHDEGWCTRTAREARCGAACPKCNPTSAKPD